MPRLPPILRPRLTVKYVLSASAALYVLYCFMFGKRLLSTDLPPYSGPYDVGAIDIEAPSDRGAIASTVVKATGKPAFQLDTVLFTVYYPAAKDVKSWKPKHLWIPKPLAVTAEGYARFARINNFFTNHMFTLGLWAIAGGNRIPAEVDVPIRPATEPLDDELERSPSTPVADDTNKLPVIVFSHGMASSRTDYTQYCGELASRGYVVAAIEHRDGSGPGTVVMSGDGQSRNVFHSTLSELERDPPLDTAGLKEEQVDFRIAEIEETIRVLRALNDGDGAQVFKENPRKEGHDLINWEDRLDMDRVVLGGHSYGATTVLRAMKKAPSESLPLVGCIALDAGKSSGPLNDDIRVPALIINSNSWSSKHSIFMGRQHFDVVKAIAQEVIDRGNGAWFMTSLETSHPSCTDAPIIEPTLLSWTTGATIDVREGVQQYVKRTMEFMHYVATGKRTGILAEKVTHPDYDKDSRTDAQKHAAPDELTRYWQIHIAPNDS